jgi:DNA-directed RNA polymerase specialized sigma subunit
MPNPKEYLKQVKLYNTHINNKLDEMDRLKDIVTKVTTSLSFDPVHGSGNQDKLGNAVAAILDLQTEVNKAIDAYIDKKREICMVIDQIPDPDQLRVLYKRYFDDLTWEQIACDMHMSYRNVCYIHGKALQAVGKILEEKKVCT